MDLAEFDYDLPAHLIAQKPPRERDGARMLVLYRREGRWEDRMFRDLPGFVGPGECVVLNDSRVLPSRLFGHRPGRPARIQLFLVERLTEDGTEWTALVRPGRKARRGDLIEFGGGLKAEIVAWGEGGERTVRFANASGLEERLEQIGHVPLPPYIHRPDNHTDRERYQTVYARERGSVAAPTAGLHFTEDTLQQIEARGAQIARVTLHVGLGTFQPVHAARIQEHRMHAERYTVANAEWAKVAAANRVVAIGTTSVRTIETAARDGKLAGETDIYIYPGFCFRRIGAMLTNFHLPRTTLLFLVGAFAGKELVLAAYRHAVEQQYRFFSYGDCMLIV